MHTSKTNRVQFQEKSPMMSTPKSVKFVHVDGVTFDLEQPTYSLNPLPKLHLKLLEGIIDEKEEENCSKTKANAAMLAE